MRHISFDFWNTIGDPNPHYAGERSRLLADIFCTSVAHARTTYSSVKNSLDTAAENGQIDHGRDYNITALCRAFNYKADKQFEDQLMNDLDQLFCYYPPVVDEQLITGLYQAFDKGITLSIASNTNFISGQTIMDYCIGQLPFAFVVFSDQIGLSKPNCEFFKLVSSMAYAVNPAIANNSEICHIGDSKICDGEGAKSVSMNYCYNGGNPRGTADVLGQLLNGGIVE